MKKYAFGLFALVLAVGFSSFTSVRVINTWFKLNSMVSAQIKSSILTPSNYTNVGTTAPSNPSADIYLLAIKVDGTTEIYTSGSFVGKPKVDVSNSSLQNDIIFATDIDNGSAAPAEIASRVILDGNDVKP